MAELTHKYNLAVTQEQFLALESIAFEETKRTGKKVVTLDVIRRAIDAYLAPAKGAEQMELPPSPLKTSSVDAYITPWGKK